MRAKKITKALAESNDIDALLNQAAPSDLANEVAQVTAAPPKPSQLNRLNARVTHVQRDLTEALSNTSNIRNLLDEDAAISEDFSVDSKHWENTLTALEAALPITSADTGASATPGKTNATSNSHRDRDRDRDREMVQILASQETRIKELEAKLSELQQGSGADIEHTSRNGLLDHSLADPNVNRLIITMNAASNQKFPLTQNIMTIGRDPQNDIQIRSRYISRFHARIVSDHEGSVIEDLDSQNGVNVNACKATRKRLSSGDLIDLGRIQLKFIDLMELSSSEGQA